MDEKHDYLVKRDEMEMEGASENENYQVWIDDPYVRLVRPVPRKHMTEMMTAILSEMKLNSKKLSKKPYKDLEFYLPGTVGEIETILREFQRRKIMAYCSLHYDDDDNLGHKLEDEWPAWPKNHCLLCNDNQCIWWGEKELFCGKLFDKNVKKYVLLNKLEREKGMDDEDYLKKLEPHLPKLRFLAYKQLSAVIHGKVPVRIPLPECVELRCKYWFCNSEKKPFFKGFQEDKEVII